jgi:hypothetical protein
MSEDVSISSDGACILVRSSGPPSLAELDATLARIAVLRAQHGIGRILVDSRARTGKVPLPDLIAGGKLLAARLGDSARVAVLVREIDDAHVFFRVTAAGLGAAVAYFVDPARADTWLSSED